MARKRKSATDRLFDKLTLANDFVFKMVDRNASSAVSCQETAELDRSAWPNACPLKQKRH